jgi:peptidoglycan hydrolase CwlO-like protein
LVTKGGGEVRSLACATAAEFLCFTRTGPDSMRTLFTDTDPLRAHRRRALSFAAVLVVALCGLALLLSSTAPAASLEEKRDSTQSKLNEVEASSSALAEQIAAQNAEIDSMIGEVSALRQEEAAIQAQLVAKEEELEAATVALEKEEEHLVEVRGQLNRALGALRERLVSIYEAGSPDVLNAILESEDWSDMAAQTEYLNRIQSYDNAVVSRVKTLRDEVQGAVGRLTATRGRIEDARNSIAATEREVAVAKEAAEARFAELKVAQAERRETMNALESKEEALSNNLSAISEQIATQRAEEAAANAEASGVITEAAGEFPAPLNAGESVGFISESEASAPESAPEQVKGAVAAANAIAMTPYIWGGGHGSFESSGYDCSGAVSYALHGGGLLESPLDSTGLETWGEPGPGKWITVYANAEHAWMIIGGLAFDTVGGPGPRWHSSPVDSPEGFIARHPPGL